MSYQNILTENKNETLYITINRPKNLNALNKDTIAEISHAIGVLNETAQLKGAIITGSGDKAFVAGADIKEFSAFNAEQGQNLAKVGQDTLFNKIEQSAKPVIACVNGYALGGGCELAMACHLRVASVNAKFGLPEVTLGLIPGYGGTQRLVQLVGKGKALELLMTAQMIDGAEAEKLGLANYCVEQEELLAKAEKILSKIYRNAPLAIGKAIGAVNAHFEDGNNGFETEIAAFGELFDTNDFKEGVSAFMEKRKAGFKGK